MSRFVEVARAAEIPPGFAKAVVAGGREIAVFHVGDEFYAIDNACPHQGGPLAEGWLEGNIVTCPWHAWCFDLRSGTMTLGDLAFVACFEVRVEQDGVYVSTQPVAR